MSQYRNRMNERLAIRRKFCTGLCAVLVVAGGVSAPGSLFQVAPSVEAADASSQPIALVNGVAVLQAQVENVVRQMLSQQRQPIPQERWAEVQEAWVRQAVDLLVGRELLAQEAAQRGIEVTREELDGAVNEVRGRLPEGQTLEQVLRSQGLTRSAFETNIIREQRVNRLIDRIGETLPLPDEEALSAFYAEHPDQFEVPERVSVRHILIGLLGSDDERVRDVRRRKAEALRRQVVDGQDFSNLAMLHSDDASRTRGGEVGFLSRERIQPALAETAFALRENEVSEVVESPAGYHVLQVLERQPARTIPLDEAHEQIRTFLTEQAREEAVQALVDRLREAATIEFLR